MWQEETLQKNDRIKQINVITRQKRLETLNAIFKELSSIDYACLHWIECYDDNCLIYKSEKKVKYYSKKSRWRKRTADDEQVNESSSEYKSSRDQIRLLSSNFFDEYEHDSSQCIANICSNFENYENTMNSTKNAKDECN